MASEAAGEAAAREPITVGTFCSGTDAPIFALRQAGIPHRHVFSAETNKHARTFIQANCPPETLYGDIMALDLATVPRVDLFVAGPPCQPFSGMNQKRISSRMDARVNVLHACLRYIEHKRPKFVVLENVVALRKYWSLSPSAEDEGTSFVGQWKRNIAPVLQQIRCVYNTSELSLTPLQYDCPQSRPRFYVFLSQGDIFNLPPSRPNTILTYMDLLDGPSAAVYDDLSLSPTAKRYLEAARLKFGPEWRGGVNCRNTIGLVTAQRNVFPHRDHAHCILSQQPSIICHLNRYLSRRELCRFQGFSPDIVDLCYSTLTFHQFSRLLGNAMNVKILQSIFNKKYTVAESN